MIRRIPAFLCSLVVALTGCLGSGALAPLVAQESVDLTMTKRIIEEGLERSEAVEMYTKALSLDPTITFAAHNLERLAAEIDRGHVKPSG